MSDNVQDILKKRELQRLHELENTISRKDSLNREEKYISKGLKILFAPDYYDIRKDFNIAVGDYGTYYLKTDLVPNGISTVPAETASSPKTKKSKPYYNIYLNIIDDDNQVVGRNIKMSSSNEAVKAYTYLRNKRMDVLLDYDTIIIQDGNISKVREALAVFKNEENKKDNPKNIDNKIPDDYEF